MCERCNKYYKTSIMKKIILSGLILATMGITIFSCNKEKVTPSNQIENNQIFNTETQIEEGLTIKDNLLTFDNEESFEKIVNNLHSNESLDEWEKNINFNSYRTSTKLEKQIEEFENNDKDHPFTDLPLATVINDKGFIAIENWIFKFVINNNEVRVLDKEYEDEISSFLQSEVTEHSVSYNFEDDIWSELKESQLKWGCDDKCSSSKTKKYNGQSWTQYRCYTQNGTTYKFSVYLEERYDNWGLYRKLFTKFKHKEKNGGTHDNTAFNIGYSYSYKVKCRSTTGSSSHNIPMSAGNPLSPTSYEFYGHSKCIEHYKGTRCLSELSLSSWASYQDRYSGSIRQIYNIGTITH